MSQFNLIYMTSVFKEEGLAGFSKGWHGTAASKDFPKAKPNGNLEAQPCQSKENPVHPDYLFSLTFCKQKKYGFAFMWSWAPETL